MASTEVIRYSAIKRAAMRLEVAEVRDAGGHRAEHQRAHDHLERVHEYGVDRREHVGRHRLRRAAGQQLLHRKADRHARRQRQQRGDQAGVGGAPAANDDAIDAALVAAFEAVADQLLHHPADRVVGLFVVSGAVQHVHLIADAVDVKRLARRRKAQHDAAEAAADLDVDGRAFRGARDQLFEHLFAEHHRPHHVLAGNLPALHARLEEVHRLRDSGGFTLDLQPVNFCHLTG